MSKPPPSLDDYDAIEAAVRETERGRWFLQEFARRNRAADTAQILDALASLEARIQAPAPPPSLDPIAPLFDDEWALALLDRDAGARPVPTLMLAQPAETEPPATDVADLAVTPPIDDASADFGAELHTPIDVDAPAPPRLPAARMRVEAELAELAGLRASLSRSDVLPPPPLARPAAARAAPLLESLSEAEKALLFA